MVLPGGHRAGPVAHRTSDSKTIFGSLAHVAYDPDTGALLFDADGPGGAHALQFATLAGRPDLADGDFVLV
jgi:Ca2+-binding RTX toxin-like protein